MSLDSARARHHYKKSAACGPDRKMRPTLLDADLYTVVAIDGLLVIGTDPFNNLLEDAADGNFIL